MSFLLSINAATGSAAENANVFELYVKISSGLVTKEKIAAIGLTVFIKFLSEELAREICLAEAKRLNLNVFHDPLQDVYDLAYVAGTTQAVQLLMDTCVEGSVSPVTGKSLILAADFAAQSIFKRNII